MLGFTMLNPTCGDEQSHCFIKIMAVVSLLGKVALSLIQLDDQH